jgi:hypothetical protein
MGVVNLAVEDGVGIGRVADEGMPFIDGDLAGKDRRAAAITFLEDFVEITPGAGVERFEAPIGLEVTAMTLLGADCSKQRRLQSGVGYLSRRFRGWYSPT